MLKKFPLDKVSGTKSALFFPSLSPTYRSFTLNLRFLYELKHKVRFYKIVCRIFNFRFRFHFIKVHIFVQQKYKLFDFKMASWTLTDSLTFD